MTVTLAFDGWLLFVQRVSYVENTLMAIIVAGFLLYERALRRPPARRFALAGAMFGFAAVYAQRHISADGVVLTEEEIGDEIGQPWCAVARAGRCGGAAARRRGGLRDHLHVVPAGGGPGGR